VKDTTKNVKATKGFVVNIISEPWVNQAHLTSIDAPEGVSEWPVSGLAKETSVCYMSYGDDLSRFSKFD